MRQKKVEVIGAGLAGSEAAWHLAEAGIEVDLYEMRPHQPTEAHLTDQCAELVCSNSFGSVSEGTASALLKEELQKHGAFILSMALEHRVPAGASLAVDREVFSQKVTQKLQNHPLIHLIREEQKTIDPTRPTILASGPLTSKALSDSIKQLVGDEALYFYDAISPIVVTESIDMDKLFFASRYDKGTPDFLNLPLNKAQYDTLVQDIIEADTAQTHEFDKVPYFESCLPIEVLAKRGPKTLSFGPMKPVGLANPKTGERAHAVIQLRAENHEKTAYNLVGFQTRMKYGEQLRIFKKLPGLENAEFVRLGSIHRNTYLNSPKLLLPTLQLKAFPNVMVAGQLTGTEGYLESSATGFVAGRSMRDWVLDRPSETYPRETMLGSLLHKITDASIKNFQPTNANMALLPPLETRIKDKKLRRMALIEQARRGFGESLK